jgi:hypothetical protein
MRLRRLLLTIALVACLPLTASIAAAADQREEVFPPGWSPEPSMAVTTGDADAPAPASSARPAELVGSWYTGTISSIQYYDPVDGAWADPNGEGFYLILDADGGYEEGAVIQSTMYSCSSRLLGRAVGDWSIEGYQLWLARESGETSIVGNCSGSGTNTMGPQVDIYYWELGPDEYGVETLTLKMSDLSPYAAYRRWED